MNDNRPECPPPNDLERNAKYRAEAVQPMVRELQEINRQLYLTNDLLAELIKRSR